MVVFFFYQLSFFFRFFFFFFFFWSILLQFLLKFTCSICNDTTHTHMFSLMNTCLSIWSHWNLTPYDVSGSWFARYTDPATIQVNSYIMNKAFNRERIVHCFLLLTWYKHVLSPAPPRLYPEGLDLLLVLPEIWH